MTQDKQRIIEKNESAELQKIIKTMMNEETEKEIKNEATKS